MEQKHLINLAIFSVCLSQEWGSRERHVIRDIKVVLKEGAEVYLFCCKDSPIDEEAQKLGVNCLYYSGQQRLKLFRWQYLRKIQKLIENLNINLVHIYELEALWPACFFLRRDKMIPLIFTGGNTLTKRHIGLFRKLLISRVDKVLLLAEDNEENIRYQLGLKGQKVRFCGMGLEVLREIPQLQGINLENTFSLGTAISGHNRDFSQIEFLIKAFYMFREKNLFDSSVKLLLACEEKLSTSEIFEKLKYLVKEFDLDEHVLFCDRLMIPALLNKVDIWLGINGEFDLEDRALESLMSGTPVIIPRRGQSTELFLSYGKIGETYSYGDMREICFKIEKVLRQLSFYKERISKNLQRLENDFGHKAYRSSLLDAYSSTITRRARLARFKLKKI